MWVTDVDNNSSIIHNYFGCADNAVNTYTCNLPNNTCSSWNFYLQPFIYSIFNTMIIYINNLHILLK